MGDDDFDFVGEEAEAEDLHSEELAAPDYGEVPVSSVEVDQWPGLEADGEALAVPEAPSSGDDFLAVDLSALDAADDGEPGAEELQHDPGDLVAEPGAGEEDADRDPFDVQVDLTTEDDAEDAVDEPEGDSISALSADEEQCFEPVAGDPAWATEAFHAQVYPDTCAIVCQEFILEDLTGDDWSEEVLRDQAIEMGWYIPGEGTTLSNVGLLLEANGVDTAQSSGNVLDDLERELQSGNRVIACVDSGEIWGDPDEILGELGFMPDGMDHAVVVAGIEAAPNGERMVVLKDPGDPLGGGSRVPEAVFRDAWEEEGGELITAIPRAA